MNNKIQDRVSKSVYFIDLMFFLYFVILFAERLSSLIRSAVMGVYMFEDGFNGFVYGAAIASITATVFCLLVFERKIFAAPFTLKQSIHDLDYSMLSRIAGVELLSGMVHTEYTLAPLQFCAYGALIIGMMIKTALSHKTAENKLLLWLSVIYLTAFSMAIPVMYRTGIKHYIPYYCVEAVTTIALIVCFTFMLEKVFVGKAQNLFYIVPIALAIVGDSVIIALPWHEKVNVFVLIFLCLSAALWIVGKVISLVNAKRLNAVSNSKKAK